MAKIKLLKGEFTIVDDEDFEWLNQYKWFLSLNGYVVCRKGQGNKTILMHRLINKTLYNFPTDHINRNKLDNRKDNLRTVTIAQNSLNTGLWKHNTSGVKGVTWERRRKKWKAQIQVNYKNKGLGEFNNFGDAVIARKEAERIYHGEYARIQS